MLSRVMPSCSGRISIGRAMAVIVNGCGCAPRQASPCRQRRRLSGVDRLVLFLERNLLTRRRYRLIVAISARVRADLIRHYAVPPEDIRVIYNGVDTQRFIPRPARSVDRPATVGDPGGRVPCSVHGLRLRAQGARSPVARVAGRRGESLVGCGRARRRDRPLPGAGPRARRRAPREVPRPRVGARHGLCGRRRLRAPGRVRALFQRVSGSTRLRPSGRHDPGCRCLGVVEWRDGLPHAGAAGSRGPCRDAPPPPGPGRAAGPERGGARRGRAASLEITATSSSRSYRSLGPGGARRCGSAPWS